MELKKALSRAAVLCSKKEYCPRQIEDKLRTWEVDEKDIEPIIQKLAEEDFLNIERFCNAFCMDKFRYNHWGKIKLRQALRMNDIPSDQIDEALEHIDEGEYLAQLQDALRKKNKTLKDSDNYVRKGKLIRHAASRGFELDLIVREVENMLR